MRRSSSLQLADLLREQTHGVADLGRELTLGVCQHLDDELAEPSGALRQDDPELAQGGPGCLARSGTGEPESGRRDRRRTLSGVRLTSGAVRIFETQP